MPRRISLRVVAATIALFAFAGACDKKEETPPPAAAPVPAAPAPKFKVQFETSKGNFVVEVDPALAPIGAERFRTLVDSGYFTDVRFFRVLEGFVAQFGMHGDPAVNERWRTKTLMDEPVKASNTRGTIVYAKPGMPNARSNQFFINLADNSGSLDPQGFSPFGQVVEGMDVVDKLYAEYGSAAGDAQGQIAAEGNVFLKKEFPKLDYIKSATIIP